MKILISTLFLISLMGCPITDGLSTANYTPVTGDTIVYKTEKGEKYHTSTCRYLKDSKIQITLEKAILEGLEPCSVCKPPFIDISIDDGTNNDNNEPDINNNTEKEPQKPEYKWDIWEDLISMGVRSTSWRSDPMNIYAISFVYEEGRNKYYFKYPVKTKINSIPQYIVENKGSFEITNIEILNSDELIIKETYEYMHTYSSNSTWGPPTYQVLKNGETIIKLKFSSYDYTDFSNPLNMVSFYGITKVMEVEILADDGNKLDLSYISLCPIFYK